MGLNARELFERRGKLIHLKRLDTEYLDLYVDNLMNTSIETIILTVTPSVFNKTGIEKYVRDAKRRNELPKLTMAKFARAVDNDSV